jgi:hypothetical protein
MKKLTLSILVISAFMLQSCVFGDWDNGIVGEGDVVTEVIEIDGFTGVHASSGIDVNITQGDFYVEVVADENLHEYITVERDGGNLRIGTDRSIHRAKSKVVNVSLPELDDLKISNAGDIQATNKFTCNELDIEISSAGDLKMEVEADAIDISISSSGDCDIWGTTRDLDAQLSSAGDLNAFDLEADYVKVRVSSAGDASVYANKEIGMKASSAGNIYYKGDAEVIRSNTSSAGSIIKR